MAGLATLALVAAAVFAVRDTQPPEPHPLVATAYTLVTGQVQNFILSDSPQPAPSVAFVNADGRRMGLEDFAGGVVLVNLWATWCGPCKREMPSLDRLQAALGDAGFRVVAISQDLSGMEDVQAFRAEYGIEALPAYLDDTARSQIRFGVTGLPATFLLAPEGTVLGRMVGPAEWDSEEAVALIRHFVDGFAVPSGSAGAGRRYSRKSPGRSCTRATRPRRI